MNDACVDSWISGDTLAARKKYGERVQACPACGIRWLGDHRTAGEIITEVLKDQPFYQDGGGLTLTGGEPTFQPRLSQAILRLAKVKGIHTAMETNGHTRWKVLEQLTPYLDQILFDVKHLDSAIHRKYTGADNALILANLRRLAAATQAPHQCRSACRSSPAFNADETSLGEIAEFVMETEGLKKSCVCCPTTRSGARNTHPWAVIIPGRAMTSIAQDELNRLAEVVQARGLRVIIGG